MVSKGSAVTALAMGAAAVGLAVLATGSKSGPNPPSPGPPGPPPPKPVTQPFWNTLTAAQQATYESGLFAWYVSANEPGSGTFPAPGTTSRFAWPNDGRVNDPNGNAPDWADVTSLASAANLSIGTLAFQLSMDVASPGWDNGYVAGVVDAATFKSVSYFADPTTLTAGAKAGMKSSITAGKAKLLPIRMM